MTCFWLLKYNTTSLNESELTIADHYIWETQCGNTFNFDVVDGDRDTENERFWDSHFQCCPWCGKPIMINL